MGQRTESSNITARHGHEGPRGDTDKNCDISSVKGNVTKEVKHVGYSIFKQFVSSPGKSYGAEIGQRLKLVEMNVWGEGRASYAQTVFEITVERDMCNIFQTLHGGCAAYIVDPCSVSSLVVLGLQLKFDGTGLSQSMNLIWHHAVHCSAQIRIVSTSMYSHGRVRTMRCEIWDNDILCISAVHSTVNKESRSRESRHVKL